MMNNVEKFCLRSNDFETNVREYFKELREEHSYFDVTLATADHYQIEAPKVILAAGSKFFSDIFKQANHKNILIYLKGIKRKDLENVLNFLYNGVVNVTQEELTKFLETAQELQVKGLQSNQEDESNFNQTDAEPKYQDIETGYTQSQDTVEQETVLEFTDTFEKDEIAVVNTEEDKVVLNTNIELDLQIEEMIEKNEGMWKCKVCGKTSKSKHVIRCHAETHIKGLSHKCHLCNRMASTRPSLQMHIQNFHCELSFDCDICGKVGMNKIAYKKHKSYYHTSKA